MRDLARNLDKKSQGIFEEALSQQRIQYDTYFSPKFDRNYSKKVSDNMLPEQGIHFGPLKKLSLIHICLRGSGDRGMWLSDHHLRLQPQRFCQLNLLGYTPRPAQMQG